LLLEHDLGLQTENEGSTRCKELRPVARLEPVVGRGEVIDHRDFEGIAVVVTVKEFVNEILRDVSKYVLDGLVLGLRMGNRNRTLEDAHTLWILIEYGVNILRLPKRILRVCQ